MHIVILGAGKIGQYVAQSLSLDGHSVVLVDVRRDKLEEASQKMDVAIRRGLGTDWKLLAELMEEGPQLLLALTEDDEVNLISCAIAKSLGNIKTISRIRDSKYLSCERFDIQRLFHVDHFVVPELLTADQIIKLTLNRGLYNESFFHGGVLLRTIIVPDGWKDSGKTFLELKTSERHLIAAVIRRKLSTGEEKIIFPHGQDYLLSNDEVTLIGDANLLQEIQSIFGQSLGLPRTAIIAGGTAVGAETARELCKKDVAVTIIEPSPERCYRLAEELPSAVILQSATMDLEFLRAEGVGATDVFIACTMSDEKNLQLSLFAKELGCQKVISVFTDVATGKLAEKFGILYTVSPRIATTDRIVTLARSERVAAIVSLYDQRAEIAEVKVSLNSPISGIPLSILGPRLPQEMLIAVIYNRGRLFIASGTHILSPQDEVIIVAHPRHRKYIEKVF